MVTFAGNFSADNRFQANFFAVSSDEDDIFSGQQKNNIGAFKYSWESLPSNSSSLLYCPWMEMEQSCNTKNFVSKYPQLLQLTYLNLLTQIFQLFFWIEVF